MTDIKVGHGYDVHKLVPDRKHVLGGVEINHDAGLLGHSDADVLTHAVCDALLGALGKRDIGYHFPDTDDAFRDICSLRLLENVGKMIENDGYKVSNIDATVIAQSPKLCPYIERMEKNIASSLGISPDRVNIKATTEEGLGISGSGEAMAAYAVANVISKQ